MSVSNFRNFSTLPQMGEFIKHRIYDPVVYHRNFEHDLPEVANKAADIVKRTALIALPFLAMYKPLGTVISLGMGGVRCVTHLTGTIKSASQLEALATLSHLNQTALAVICLAATVFNFQAGLLITSFADAGTCVCEAITHLKAKDYPKAAEALMQASASILYLSFMLTGTLEVMLASIVIQGAICLYQASQDLREGKYPEALAKIAMGGIRLHQAHGYFKMIQSRNAFLHLEKFAALFDKIKKGREGSHLIDSPLLEQKENVVMVDGSGNEHDFGRHFHGSGKGLVKGMNLQFRTSHVDGKNMKDIDFKVNHVFRDRLQTLIEGMKSFTPDESREFLALTQSHATGLKIEKVPFQLCEETNQTLGEAYKVTLEGLGQVLIGASTDLPGIYDMVRVQIDENKSIYELHEMLTFFNLDDVLRQSSSDDVERLKIGQLFRMFYPAEATKLERQDKFFDLPLDQFKAELVKHVPQMKKTMDQYLDKMETTEILPGRLRYALQDISKIAYNTGARALVSTITGTHGTTDACLRVASILKMGMLSTEMRYRNGMNQAGGLSPSYDFQTGGADGVFTQLLTKKNFQQKMNLDQLGYWGDVRILFSLDALNSGSYQYHEDNFGIRRVDESDSPYLTRENVFDFTKEEQRDWSRTNEVVMPYIDPQLATTILVPNLQYRHEMMNALRNQGLTSVVGGVETCMGKPLKDFVQATTHL